jgi:hypothetical protein
MRLLVHRLACVNCSSVCESLSKADYFKQNGEPSRAPHFLCSNRFSAAAEVGCGFYGL